MELKRIFADPAELVPSVITVPSAPSAPTVMGPAEVMALIRDANRKAFARTDTVADRGAESFRPVAASSLVRSQVIVAKPDDPAEAEAVPEQIASPEAKRAPLPDLETLLARAHDEGHAAGHLAGLAEGAKRGEALAQAELDHARQTFEIAVSHLIAPTAADITSLSHAMDQALCTLASQRAGQQIDLLPLPFLRRIEALADRVGQGFRQMSFRMNPEDLAAITPHLAESDLLATARLHPDARLARGDLEIVADGVHVSDILCPCDDGSIAA